MNAHAQLYLALDIAGEAAAADAALSAALDAATFACVLLRAPSGETLAASQIQPLVRAVQARDITVLVEGDTDAARTVKADGAHIAWSKSPLDTYRAGRAALGDRALIGADAGRSRHDAMELGEAGADYVAFGIPAHVHDRQTAEERQLELISWWSEIFEIPAVAFDVTSAEQAAAVAEAGADFVAITLSTAMPVEDIVATVRAVADSIIDAGVAA